MRWRRRSPPAAAASLFWRDAPWAAASPRPPAATPVEREFAAAAVTWDLNKDGDVTCDEWKQYVTGLFREADANRDGNLTRAEFAALGRRDRLLETVGLNYFDANADGRLSVSRDGRQAQPGVRACSTRTATA